MSLNELEHSLLVFRCGSSVADPEPGAVDSHRREKGKQRILQRLNTPEHPRRIPWIRV